MRSFLLTLVFAISGVLVAGCDEEGNLLTDEVDIEGAMDEVPDGIENGPPMHRHGPPPEAFEACAGLDSGNSCAVLLRDTEIDGRCRRGPDGEGELACVPSHSPHMHGPPKHRHGPPPEAFEACEALAVDSACEVEIHGRAISGKCGRGPAEDAPLACAPDGFPPPHRQEIY